MRFWDTSALIPLVLDEPTSPKMRVLHASDADLAVWWCSRVECMSAVARRLRENPVLGEQRAETLRLLAALFAAAYEITPSEALRRRAERLLNVHPLRAADAFQLAAALRWASERPSGAEFVCLDNRLREAAASESFLVLP